jgi:hypothetical protein
VSRPDPDMMREALLRIREWCDAYPVEAFGEPDIEAARELLGDGLYTSLNGSWARHLLAGVRRYADFGLKDGDPT